ncbi:MAG: GTPase HflX, partial [Chloroflexi bacterium]
MKARVTRTVTSAPLTPEESLDELTELAATAGAAVLDKVVQTRDAPVAATLIGSGLVQRLAAQAKA